MPTPLATARQRLAEHCADSAPMGAPRIVNLVGPPGIGKSRLLAEVVGAADRTRRAAPRRPWAFDGADTEHRIRAVCRRLAGAPPDAAVLVASRRPVVLSPAWSDDAVSVVELAAWTPAQIHELALAFGVTAADDLDVVVRLGGGIPLLARAVCAALLVGTNRRAAGGLADAAATAVLSRIRVEAPRLPPAALLLLATVDGADEGMLGTLIRLRRGAFDELAQLSIVRADVHGLTVIEPYRTVLDLAYRWRQPVLRQQVAARSAARRHDQVAATTDAGLRARLAEQVLFLAGRPRVRADLFAEAPGGLQIRAGAPADADHMGRLVRQWAATEGLAAWRADRMLDHWLSGEDHGFHMLVDGEDRPVGMVNLTPFSTGPAPVLEALLQQHAEPLAGPGVVVGMMSVEAQYARYQPMLVRQILASGVAHGRLLVSTPWGPYQQMCTRFGMRRLGQTHDDLYRCGRANAIYARGFQPRHLTGWLGRMQEPAAAGSLTPPVDAVRRALEQLHTPAGLVTSPLVAAAGTVSALVERLDRAVTALAASPSPADQQAAAVLTAYYLRGVGGHDLVAHRLHLSRATYFRRLQHGLSRLAELLSAQST